MVQLTINGRRREAALPRATPLLAYLRNDLALEGLGTTEAPHPVQAAFIALAAAQCGYCLNGMIMTAKALLDANPSPSEGEIREALRYNLCRCGAHIEILAAVRRAAGARAHE